MVEEAKWYVIHTYSSYEDKVQKNIGKMIGKNPRLQEQIQEVIVPMHHVLEVKDGIKMDKKKKLFPGYVLVKMLMNDETWYVIRNTRGVTGFVGPGSKPVPLTDREVRAMGIGMQERSIKVGDTVSLSAGPFKGHVGVVDRIDEKKEKITVTVNLTIFGRETPVNLDYDDINII